MTVIQLLWLGNDTMKIQETFLRLWRFGLCLILLTKIFLSSVDKRNDNKEFILKEEGNVLGAEANDSFPSSLSVLLLSNNFDDDSFLSLWCIISDIVSILLVGSSSSFDFFTVLYIVI